MKYYLTLCDNIGILDEGYEGNYDNITDKFYKILTDAKSKTLGEVIKEQIETGISVKIFYRQIFDSIQEMLEYYSNLEEYEICEKIIRNKLK